MNFWVQHSRLSVMDVAGVDPTGITDSTAGLLAAISRAKAGGRALYFPDGQYKVSKTLPFGGLKGMRYWGEGQVVIFNPDTPAQSVVSIDSGGATERTDDIEVVNFILAGNRAVPFGLYARGMHRSRVHNIRVFDVSRAGFQIEFAVLDSFADLKCTEGVDTFTFAPAKGIVITDTSGPSYGSTANTWTNLIIENPISDIGIDMVSGGSNVFIGGTSESVPTGMVLGADAIGNTILGTDFEANSVCDLIVLGKRNTFTGINASSPGSVLIGAGAEGNCFVGGYLDRLTIDRATKGTVLNGVSLSSNAGKVLPGEGGLGPFKANDCPLVDAKHRQNGTLQNVV